MADTQDIPAVLYTRQQIAVLTGLDDSTLNYWMREGLLRPAEGGGGKGQHRRFAYHQVNIALILDQLRGFGVNLSALNRLARRFQEAIAFMEANGISRENGEWIDEVVNLRRQVADKGFVKQTVHEDNLSRLLDVCPWMVERKVTREYRHLPHLDFQTTLAEAIELKSHWPYVYHRESTKEDRFTKDEIAIAMAVDVADYKSAEWYWRPATRLPDGDPAKYSGRDFEMFYRDAVGEWHLQYDPSNIPNAVASYVGVDLSKLLYEAWSKA